MAKYIFQQDYSAEGQITYSDDFITQALEKNPNATFPTTTNKQFKKGNVIDGLLIPGTGVTKGNYIVTMGKTPANNGTLDLIEVRFLIPVSELKPFGTIPSSLPTTTTTSTSSMGATVLKIAGTVLALRFLFRRKK